MQHIAACTGVIVVLMSISGHAQEPDHRAVFAPIPADAVELGQGFWRELQQRNQKVTLPACLDRAAESGRLENFRVAAGAPGEHKGRVYDNSDVYKIIEGVARAHELAPDPELLARARAIVRDIVAAQQEDGYLNTYVQLVAPDQRWQRIGNWHELYCAGHLIEAGIAWSRAGLGDELLHAARRFADHIADTLGGNKSLEPPGHQEIELALAALARFTGESKYLELAREFLERRGRGDRVLRGEYQQDHRPVSDQVVPVGHAVRLLYQSIGALAVDSRAETSVYLDPVSALWREIVDAHLHVTGGVGAHAASEGFGGAFDLPPASAYAETCAAIAMALLSHRMFLATGDARAAEIMDRAIHNGVLAGISHRGDRFFYDNPLTSDGDRHRLPFFECACCPTNVARFIPQIPGMIFGESPGAIAILLPIAASTERKIANQQVKITIESAYPFPGAITIHAGPVVANIALHFALMIREPEWCRGQTQIEFEDAPLPVARRDGFLIVEREWRLGDRIVVTMPMTPRRIAADPRNSALVTHSALALGPLIYCIEGVDHEGRVCNLVLPPTGEVAARVPTDISGDPLGGAPRVHATGARLIERAAAIKPVLVPADITAIPYFLWDNRDSGEMRVWIPQSAAQARLPGETHLACVGIETLRASHCYRHDSLMALADGVVARSSNDHEIPRMTFWDHRGTAEWIERDLGTKREIRATRLFFFDDTGRGQCRAPASWRLLAREGSQWRAVTLNQDSRYSTDLDQWNEARFAPITTDALRLEFQLEDGFSAGLLEWVIE